MRATRSGRASVAASTSCAADGATSPIANNALTIMRLIPTTPTLGGPTHGGPTHGEEAGPARLAWQEPGSSARNGDTGNDDAGPALAAPARHHGSPPDSSFGHCGLSACGPDQGPSVRRLPAKLSLERLGARSYRTLGVSPLSCFRAAEAAPTSVPSSESSCGFGSRLSVAPAVRGELHFRCSLLPLPSAPVQSGLPAGTSSCSTRDGLLSGHEQDARKVCGANCGALWKLLTALLIKCSRTCE